jgi:hypothetical protein
VTAPSPPPPPSFSPSAPPPLKVVVYDRDMTRRLRHAPNATAALQARLPPGSEVSLVVHREDRPVCELVALLSGADALVTPHGFTAMLLLLLPPGALLVEIFPYRSESEPFAPRLASAFGVDHAAVTSEPVRKLQPALFDIIGAWMGPSDESSSSSLSAGPSVRLTHTMHHTYTAPSTHLQRRSSSRGTTRGAARSQASAAFWRVSSPSDWTGRNRWPPSPRASRRPGHGGGDNDSSSSSSSGGGGGGGGGSSV